MKTWKWLVLAVGILMVVGGLALVISPTNNVSKYYYSGTLIFQTEDEYSAFKQVVSIASVEPRPSEITVIDSHMPILVLMDGLQASQNFPYGTQLTETHKDIPLQLVELSLIVLGLLGILIVNLLNLWP